MDSDYDKTIVFDIDEVSENDTYKTLIDVYKNLEERGYNPINQIAGYILSGDLGYISSYKESRNKIASLDRNALTEVLLKSFLS